MKDKRIFLIDAMALVYRAYFAFIRNPLINSKGMNTSAISGFTSTMFDLLENANPTHMAVVFDTHAPTFRSDTFADYKANRQATPDDIIESVPYIKQVVEAFNIPILELDGYEADDLIGTLAKEAEKRGYQVFMVTPDKDFGQLVSENIFMYKPSIRTGGYQVLGLPEILERWDIKNVDQVIDILGLMGDAVDNIPGIPGVGEKTAIKLLKEFHSIENLLEHTDQLKGKLREKVEANKEKAIMSKQLATIITDAPIEFDEKALEISAPDKAKLAELFSFFEFRTLGRRILGSDFMLHLQPETPPQGSQMNLFDQEASGQQEASAQLSSISDPFKELDISTTPHQYHLADTYEKRQELIKIMLSGDCFCFDTETTGLNPLVAGLVGMSFSNKEFEAWYVPCPENFEACKALVLEFKKLFDAPLIRKTGQNLKFDILVLEKYGIDVQGPFFDTMIAHFLIEPEMRHNMDLLAETYLGYRPVSIERLIGKKGSTQRSMRDVALNEIKDYAAEDADITLRLKAHFEPLIKEKNLEKLFYEIELPVMKVLADMEKAGVALDTGFLNIYSDQLQEDIVELKEAVFKDTGVVFNLDSPMQLADVLFNKLKIPYTGRKTKTGKYSTNEAVLSRLAHEHEIARKLLDYRELTKLKSTYVDALAGLVSERTGRLHTTYSQTIAVTGRLSSSNPNLQNIPIRSEKGRAIRKAFIAGGPDRIIISADYSQIELRIIASLSEDESMMEDFRSHVDVHTATASKVFNIKTKDVSKDLRRKAKMVNFGIIYGISAFGLGQRLGISRTEAAGIIASYFKKYPGIKQYMNESIEFARNNGYAKTLFGRRRNLPDIKSGNATVRGFAERNAINTPIQGSAADIIKIAMIKLHENMKTNHFKSLMTLQVHDELVFDAVKDEVDLLIPLIRESMEKAVELNVPLVVDIGQGVNWLEAH